MTSNKTPGTRSALLTAIAVTAYLFPASVADAQESVTDDLLACDRVSAAPERLACFNDIVRRLKAGEAPEAAKIGEPTQPPAVAAAKSIPGDFGLEKKLNPEGIKKKQTERVLTAKVVRHWENSLGRLVVQLDNDQVWTEVVSYHARFPKGEVRVEIKPGRFGGYRMRFNDNVAVVKVKRLK